jgi:flagellar motility protein MotE (MotC chaperone)
VFRRGLHASRLASLALLVLWPVVGAAAEEKPSEKSPDKSIQRSAEKPAVEKPKIEGADGKPVDRLADKLSKDAASAQKVKKAVNDRSLDAAAASTVSEPESSPPPLRIGALHEEIKRRGGAGGGGGEHGGPRSDRESLSKMAADVNNAREALRQDTARMEAMLAGADAAGGEGEGGKKVPTPLDVVAKAMRGMKPEQAAPIVAHMDRKLAADVLQRMPSADAGKVMGLLKPELAAELAAEIALRGRLERKR